MSAEKKELSLYIHIPFCKRKCYYCDFCSFTEGDRSIEERYVLRICEELKKSAESALGYCVSTVYFGGGTPSLLDASMIAKMLDAVRSDFELSSDAEITIECNPATAREGFFEEIRAAGVNRLSIGLQSADDCELSALGRLHNFAEFEKTYYDARRAGFDNISVDLMYGIPDQTLQSFSASLERVVALSPEHISSYLLKIEEGTVFAKRESTLSLCDEDTQFEMYSLMTNFLAQKGYYKYEVSNFAKPGFESRHNVGYWTGREYIGFGVAAYSFFGGERFGNSRDLRAFLAGEDITDERERISDTDAAFEFVMLGMRMGKGIDLAEYKERFGRSFDTDFVSAEKFESLGLLSRREGRLAFTDKGFFVSNTVLSDFLEDFSKAVDNRDDLL